MFNFKCTLCGGILIEEGMTNIYFCQNCKAIFFKNKNGKFVVRKGKKIK